MTRTVWTLAVLALLAAACGSPVVETEAPRAPVTPEPEDVTEVSPDTEPESEPATVGDPDIVSIPAIGVEATLVGLGLQDDGAMEVPDFGLAGWYTPGPRPGEPGPAVIAAHVDSKEGPDVFYRLHELKPGNVVTVVDQSGADHAFTLERTEQHAKNELPVEAIWGPTDRPALRLITCGGTFDSSIGHYDDNVIVWATA